jgi:transposase
MRRTRTRSRWPARACRRVAAELVSDLERICQRKKAADKELSALLRATATTLTGLNGIGPSGAARLLIEAGDITRFPSRSHFASWNGTAPIDASSGDQVRHRLSRAGNRQINRTLHIMAVVQLRHRDSQGRAYFDRKVAAGKTPREAMRCLKRRLSDIVYHQMILDARDASGPGRTHGDGYWLQRGRLTPRHRHFGEVTSRTRHHPPYDPLPGSALTQRGAM